MESTSYSILAIITLREQGRRYRGGDLKHFQHCKTQMAQFSDIMKHRGKYNDTVNKPVDVFVDAIKQLRELVNPRNIEILVFTVAFHPKIPDFTPSQIEKKGLALKPLEYLCYVITDLTLEDRETLMLSEDHRYKTFMVHWPHSSIENLSGKSMAEAGFYSVDDFDRVQCAFCRGSLHLWDPDDEPLKEHEAAFPFCKFIKGLECGNKPMSDEPECSSGSGSTASGGGSNTTVCERERLSTKPSNPEYSTHAARVKSFSNWPRESPIKPHSLCDAGFYYTTTEDKVRCFWCSGGVGVWDLGDNPWIEHAKWFPDCPYLIQQKGRGFVYSIQADHSNKDDTIKPSPGLLVRTIDTKSSPHEHMNTS